jgi:heat shock protein HtpX
MPRGLFTRPVLPPIRTLFAAAIADGDHNPILDPEVRRRHRQQNRAHTLTLLGGIGLMLAVPVGMIWGLGGLMLAGGLIAMTFFGARQVPAELVMRAYRAQPVTAQSAPGLVHILEVLAERADIAPVPRLYVIPSLTLNAFATGVPSNAAIAITEGLVRKLSTRELAAVLAHEISHVRNNDLTVMAIADIASRLMQLMSYLAVFLVALNFMSLAIDGEAAVSWLAIVILYLAPVASSLMQLALSRTREYDADLEAAVLTGDPSWLVSALQRFERQTGAFWEDLMFPVPGRRQPQPSLLRTHPPTEERVARLRALANRREMAPIDVRDAPYVSVLSAGPIAMRPRYRFPGIWY